MLYAEKCENRNSAAVTAAVKKALETRSITLGNGSEFARYREIEAHYTAPVFFADPRPPWQRGQTGTRMGSPFLPAQGD
jgi:IS30 family transposase